MQAQLVQCQQAWYSTIPPGQRPLRLPDGRTCLLNATMALDLPSAPNSSLAFSVLEHNVRRLAQLNSIGPVATLGPLDPWVSYTELQCTGGATGPLCGACTPGTYVTSGWCDAVP